MKINQGQSNAFILKELGSRLATKRLNLNLTQAELAERAGVSRPTIQRLEEGRSTQLSNLMRVLRALGLITNLETLVPEQTISPMLLAKSRSKERKRASSGTSQLDSPDPNWKWGDE